jgi:hypothetical protein
MIPTRGGAMVYRCRLCGIEDRSIHSPSIETTARSLLAAGKATGVEYPAVTRMTRLHGCGDGRQGIADLVGFEPDAEDTTPDWYDDVPPD